MELNNNKTLSSYFKSMNCKTGWPEIIIIDNKLAYFNRFKFKRNFLLLNPKFSSIVEEFLYFQ